jgi:hypothetical protein
MGAFLRYSIALLVAYFLAWTTAYVYIIVNAVNRLDFSEYVHWFVLAWTFNGLEMVAFTWFFSLIAFVPFAVIAIVLARRIGR